MKSILTIILFLSITLSTAWSQANKASNSFDSTYKKTNPALKYNYDEINQIHNYSDNWDFDMDGINDDLLFIGTGGTHLYYYLRIVLSSDNIVRDYKYLELDYPYLANNDKLNDKSFNTSQRPIQFAIFDSDKDGLKDIFIHLDDQTMAANSKQLKKHKIDSTAIVITFKKKKVKLNNYSA